MLGHLVVVYVLAKRLLLYNTLLASYLDWRIPSPVVGHEVHVLLVTVVVLSLHITFLFCTFRYFFLNPQEVIFVYIN
jgi:hypothetical protein